MPALILALVSALWLAAADAQPAGQQQQRQQQQQRAPACSDVFRVAQRSFQQLPSAKYAYVWVDDIKSKIFSGYYPFAVFVIVGGVYPPFQANSGKLDRASFDKLTASAYNTKRFGPLQVTEDAVTKGSAVLQFEAGGRGFSLKVADVVPSFGGDDAINVQVCNATR